ncbi:MAG: ATP-binding cassette domain-containing protein [Verrucomicrobiales bacterium]|nr:ATP-binding cassette domain-containing protein [Verrucomicrobiales bacterium]
MDDITVTRGGRDILRKVNWEVNEGEHWALIGGNGSGKTSLLKVLMGYLTPTDGEIDMPGRYSAIDSPDQEWDKWRKNIGFVSSSIAEMIEPAETALDVVMAGRHAMVNYWQKNAAVEKADGEAARKILGKVNCSHLRDHPWAYLSQGERQRLLIGRALMSPQLDALVLDEPCAGLDPVAREHFLHFIQELTGQKAFRSLVMVTHHVEEIFPNISHALIIREGITVACGEKKDALTSRTISDAFGGELKLRSRDGRYRISFGQDDIPAGQVV